jgi:hypothetical protein
MVPCWQEIKRILMVLQDVEHYGTFCQQEILLFVPTFNSVAEAKYFDKLRTLYSDPNAL